MENDDYVRKCRKMSEHVGTCRKMSNLSDLLENVRKFRKMLEIVGKCPENVGVTCGGGPHIIVRD